MLLCTTFALAKPVTVYADDEVSSMDDMSQHFANAGGYWANSKDPSENNRIKGVGRNWNYFGNGQQSSILTNSAKGMKTGTFSALYNYPIGGKSDGNHSLYNAARFSFAMNSTGLDHQYNGAPTGFTKAAKFCGAWLTTITLWLCSLGQVFLTIVFDFFQWVNPFHALGYLVNKNPSGADKTFFASLLDTIRPLYKSLTDMTMSWSILVFAIAILMALMGYSKSQNGYTGNGIGNNNHGVIGASWGILKKMIIMFVAPLMIGALADGLTDELKDDASVNNTIVLKQIYGNYIDFSGWAQNSRLALPDGDNTLTDRGDTSFSPSYILKINAYGAQNSTAKDVINDKSNYKGTDSLTHVKSSAPSNIANDVQSTFSKVGSTASWLTGAYASGSTINGTDWESRFRTELIKKVRNSKGYDDGYQKNPYAFLYDEKNTDEFGAYGKDKYQKAEDFAFYKDFSLQCKSHKGGGVEYYSNTPQENKAADIGSDKGAGLSSIGLYNYLNTRSDGSGITYSQPKTFLGLGSVNQHASTGFVGRSILFIGSYVRMIAIMATAGLMVLFVVSIIYKGIIGGAPRIMLYTLQLGSGSWYGFVGVFKELVNMYARIIVGMLIVFLFNASAETIMDKIETLLNSAMGVGSGLIFHLGSASVSPLPMAAGTASTIIGIIRIIETLGCGLAIFVLLKTYGDILKFLDKAIQRIMDAISKTNAGHRMMPTPKATAAGMNNSSNTDMSNSSNASNNNDETNSSNSLDDSNDSDDIFHRSKDPNNNLTPDDQSAHGLRSGLAGLAMDGLNSFENSTLGGGLMKGASAVMGGVTGALAGTKLGDKMGLKNKAQGANLLDNAMQNLKQRTAEAMDPTHANDSKRAGLGKKDKELLDQTEKADTDALSEKAGQKAIENAQKDAKLTKNFDENGELKPKVKKENQVSEGEATQELVERGNATDELKDAHEEFGKRAKAVQAGLQANAKTAKDKVADAKDAVQAAKDNVQDAKDHLDDTQDDMDQAKDNVEQAQDGVEQAQNDVEQAKDEVEQAKDEIEQARTPAQKKRAQQHLTNAQQKLAQAQKKQTQAQKKRAQAQAKYDTTQAKYDDAKQSYNKAKRSLSAAQKQHQVAKTNAKKAEFSADTKKRADYIAATGLDPGLHGENIKALNKDQIDKARERQFTALTGKSAKGEQVASPSQIKKVKSAKAKALQTLNNPNATAKEREDAKQTLHDADVVLSTGKTYGKFATPVQDASASQIQKAKSARAEALQTLSNPNATTKEREDANQTLHDANVVLNTGKAYGKFATPAQNKALKDASINEMQTANKASSLDKAAIKTGFTTIKPVKEAKKATLAEKQWASNVSNAHQVLNTNQVRTKDGTVRQATAQERKHAQQVLQSAPAHQLKQIQNQMISSSNDIQTQATNFADRKVAALEPGATPEQIEKTRTQAIETYFAKPAVQNQMKSAGLISQTVQEAQASNASPQLVQAQVQQARANVTKMVNVGQDAKQGLAESIAPLRQMVQQNQGMPSNVTLQNAGRQAWEQQYASAKFVTNDAYKKLTNKQFHQDIMMLRRANSSGNQKLIAQAHKKAMADGIASHIVTSPANLEKVYAMNNDSRDRIIRQTVDHAQKSAESVSKYHMNNDEFEEAEYDSDTVA